METVNESRKKFKFIKECPPEIDSLTPRRLKEYFSHYEDVYSELHKNDNEALHNTPKYTIKKYELHVKSTLEKWVEISDLVYNLLRDISVQKIDSFERSSLSFKEHKDIYSSTRLKFWKILDITHTLRKMFQLVKEFV